MTGQAGQGIRPDHCNGINYLVIQSTLIATLIGLAATAHAATLQISPVTVNLDSGTNAVGLTLRNPGDQALYGQIRVFRWSQQHGEDQLSETDELIASPPLIQIPARSEQLVRLVRHTIPPTAIEQSYRLLIDELPASQDSPNAGVTIRLRYSVPVFVAPAGIETQAALTWQLVFDNKQNYLNVINNGNRHAQISEVKITGPDGKRYDVNAGLLGYALAAQGRRWQIPRSYTALSGDGLTIQAKVNGTPVDAALIHTPPR